MTADGKNQKCCAICKRWDGDANLSNEGVAKGRVNIKNPAARGKCIVLKITKNANECCRDFSISPEAERYIM